MSVKDLQAEARGMDMYYSMLQGQVKWLSDDIKDDKKKVVPVGEISLEEIHVLTYQNFRIFGRIENKIKSTCFMTEDPTGPADVKGRVDAKVKQCMGLLKLYCELSLGRQMLLAQLSSLARKKKLWVRKFSMFFKSFRHER